MSAERPGLTASALMTAAEVAARWQVATAHVHRLARDGRLPVVRLGRYVRFERSAIERFERDGGTS